MKIPFERTIAGAYRFVFENFLSVIGIAWLPILILCLTTVGFSYWLLAKIGPLLSIDQSSWSARDVVPLAASIGAAAFLLVIVLLVTFAMVNVGLLRKALGQHPGPVFVFFSLGAQVWRMIGAYLLLIVFAWGIAIAAGLGIAGISFLLSKISPAAQLAGTVILGCGGVLFGVYLLVCVQFFLPAIVVAENRIGFGRAWHLGRGNFWRIVGIVLAVTLPAYFASQILLSTVFQVAAAGHAEALSALSPGMQTGRMTPEEVRRMFDVLLQVLAGTWPILVLIEVLYMAAVSGFSAAAVAIAYNLVTGAPSDAAQPDATKASA